MSKQAYKLRLYPTKKQGHALTSMLERCRELYNTALQERRDAYRMVGKSITYYDQAKQLPDTKAIRQDYQEIHSQVLQDVLRKAEKTFQAFFARCKRGERAGFPRYKGKEHFDSFTYPQTGWSITQDNRICLAKLGSIKVKVHREVQGTVKTCILKREDDCWFVVFSCEVEHEPLEVNHKVIGIDLGLLHFATLSDGSKIENPRHYRKAQKKLARAQQGVSRKKRDSQRRKKAIKQVANCHRKVRNQRQDFLHKASRKLVNRYGTIIFEQLQTANMSKRPQPKQDVHGTYLPNGASAKAGLNTSIFDAGWGQFQQYCVYKAEEAGRSVLFVNPKYSSQICSGCGTIRKKTLDERWHSCTCGCKLDRDHNAAINIFRLGRSHQLAQVG